MYKIKKKVTKAEKAPILYNIIEDYTESDPPGNVTVCAMTESEDISAHARVLSESYEIPLEVMTRLLTDGGIYIYPQTGLLVTQGVFTCQVDPAGLIPKQTWVLDVMQYAEAEQLVRSYGVSLEDASARVFYRTLAIELQDKLTHNKLGMDDQKPGRASARSGDIRYIDFRKDWSPHFKRLCIMPDGRLIETGGLADFAGVHGITLSQARRLIEEGRSEIELQDKRTHNKLGMDDQKPGRASARSGDIRYIDFRKDWSPHFKRLCIMPDGRLIETGGLADFAGVHGITLSQARRLIEEGGTLEVDHGEILACQIVNGQPSVARFSRSHYAKAKDLVATKELHLMDALSDVALSDPLMMRALKRLEQTSR